MGPLMQTALVAVGGSLGALLRFAVNGWALRHVPSFVPAGTLIANVTGCLVIGIVMTILRERPIYAKDLQALVVTGFLGGFTTFSAFGYQTVELLLGQQPGRALLNVMANLVLGFCAVWLGIVTARRFLDG